jgi:hypothetical protein
MECQTISVKIIEFTEVKVSQALILHVYSH